jgi:hypothetical protein
MSSTKAGHPVRPHGLTRAGQGDLLNNEEPKRFSSLFALQPSGASHAKLLSHSPSLGVVPSDDKPAPGHFPAALRYPVIRPKCRPATKRAIHCNLTAVNSPPLRAFVPLVVPVQNQLATMRARFVRRHGANTTANPSCASSPLLSLKTGHQATPESCSGAAPGFQSSTVGTSSMRSFLNFGWSRRHQTIQINPPGCDPVQTTVQVVKELLFSDDQLDGPLRRARHLADGPIIVEQVALGSSSKAPMLITAKSMNSVGLFGCASSLKCRER